MPRSLHVQCTFNVRSLSVHCERMVPVVKSMRCVQEGVGSVIGCILVSAAALSLQLLQREHFAQGTVGGRNPAPLYLHPKTNPRTPSLTLGHCLVVRKKEVE